MLPLWGPVRGGPHPGQARTQVRGGGRGAGAVVSGALSPDQSGVGVIQTATVCNSDRPLLRMQILDN